jgi:hypothetical protein
MKIVRLTTVTLAVLVLASAGIRADVRTDQKTTLQFGGALGSLVNMFGGGGNEGAASSVAVKGNRKATLNDRTGQIIDLGEEKVYDLDVRKKTYKVTTFDELRRRMEEARKKAEADAKRSEGVPASRPAPQKDPNAKEMEVDFKIENTGQSKAINGFDTKQSIMTIHRPREGEDDRAERRHRHEGRHVDDPDDRGHEGNRRLRPALRQAAVRLDAERRVRRPDGDGARDVSDDEGSHREDERRGRQARRHRDPDGDHDHGRAVG